MISRELILLGDKTLTGVERALNAALKKHELSWTAVDAGYDSWLRELMEPTSATNRNSGAALGFLLSPRVLDLPDGGLPYVEQVLAALSTQSPSRTVLFSNVFPDPIAVMPLTRHPEKMSVAARINDRLYDFARAHSWFHVVDHAGLAIREGTRHLTDRRYEATAQMYFSPSGSRVVANAWLRVLRSLEKPASKIVVVDLDNTLWRGILGEDGAEGLEMGSSGPGWAHRELQQSLRQLRANGILLAVASKNNAEDAHKILAEHPDCLLRIADFSSLEINWGPKSESLKRMARRLGLGLDAFVFIDDSPFEREEVRSALPQVTVLEFPEDPIELVGLLSDSFWFDLPRVTKEDRERAGSYAAEAQRDALRDTATSSEAFYRSLALQLKLFRAKPAHAERLHQLILKTNQFNLTAERMTSDQFRSLLENDDALIIGLRVSDRFGDSGVTGLAMVTGIRSRSWQVDNFLLSCRVIGRTVENAFVRWLAERAAAAGAQEVRFKFKATAKNQVAVEFLQKSGLSWQAEQSTWDCAVPPTQALAAHFVTIDDQDAA